MATTSRQVPVWRTGYNKIIYTFDTDIAAGAAVTYLPITIPSNVGRVHEVYFESLSENCDVWISGKTGLLATSHLTYIRMQNINLGYSPEIKPRYVHNEDTVKVPTLYMAIDNNGAIAMDSDYYLTLTYEAY